MKTIAVAIIIAITILVGKWIDVGVKRPEPQVRVDTLRIITTVYDTVTTRAADTVRVYVRHVGPLTQRDLVNMICSTRWLNDGSGEFNFNAYGMVFCPAREDAK